MLSLYTHKYAKEPATFIRNYTVSAAIKIHPAKVFQIGIYGNVN